MFLNIAKYFKMLRCGSGAVAFIFFNLLKTRTVVVSSLEFPLSKGVTTFTVKLNNHYIWGGERVAFNTVLK